VAVLEIEDDGKGISEVPDPASPDDLRCVGIGIAGMRARMEQLGGTLNIRPGARGVVVRAAVPLDGAA
jgi:signal transduction histidine kinase